MMKKRIPLLIIILFIAGGILCLQMPAFLADRPDIAEKYALEIFPVLSKMTVSVMSFIPFSVTEICFYVLLIGIPVLLIIFIIRLCKSEQKWRLIRRTALVLSGVFFFAALQFCLFMGINYSRIPLSDSLFPEKRERNLDELIEVSAYFAKKTTDSRAYLNQESPMTLQTTISQAMVDGNHAMDTAAEKFDILAGNAVIPKQVFASHYVSYTGITGMYMPLLGEANVNTDIPAIGLPHTLCHEISHARGFAREQEANLAGFLACIASERMDFQYSGYQFAYRYIISDLYKADQEAYQAVSSLISEEVWQDWADNNEYWKSFEGPVQETAEKVNDSYLKANRQTEGVLSYSLVTELIIEYYFTYIKAG